MTVSAFGFSGLPTRVMLRVEPVLSSAASAASVARMVTVALSLAVPAVVYLKTASCGPPWSTFELPQPLTQTNFGLLELTSMLARFSPLPGNLRVYRTVTVPLTSRLLGEAETLVICGAAARAGGAGAASRALAASATTTPARRIQARRCVVTSTAFRF